MCQPAIHDRGESTSTSVEPPTVLFRRQTALLHYGTPVYNPPKSVMVSNSRIGSDGVSGHEPGTNRGLCLLTLSDYSKLKIESLRATGTSRTDSIWGISDRNSSGVSEGEELPCP